MSYCVNMHLALEHECLVHRASDSLLDTHSSTIIKKQKHNHMSYHKTISNFTGTKISNKKS